MTYEARAQALLDCGVDVVVDLPFESVRQHSGEKFVEEVIVAGLGAKFVLAGPDLRFGHRRSGSATLLAEMGPKHGFSVEVADTVLQNENRISSTRIREVISEQGDMIEAQKLLSRPHRVSGIVVHGAKRGRELGFPTANLRTLTELIPLPGIYAANARCQDGSVHAAAVSVGHNPTFGTNSLTVEAFLLDFTGDLYGQTLDLDFHARLRGEAAFDSIDALLEQMNQDVLDTRRLLLSES
jgi:riboflavin kinase/FMN adenylyltransferase